MLFLLPAKGAAIQIAAVEAIRLQSVSARPGGPYQIGLVFKKFDGDRNEEISFVSNGANDGIGFGARG
ncbi:MAG TPA: hypothetical protein VMU69_00315 [Bradyrhizobium sp.]|nr:hypothetical protein [Bradyrhizobium sp.]